jgi:SAM-dependent methyltransferase
MKLFSALETNATLYEWAQRLISLNYRVFLRELRSESFFQPGKSYLDLGCGTGFLRDYLPEAEYLGVDLSPVYIAAATRKRGSCFEVRDAMDIGKMARRFDRIVCIGLLHHLDERQARTVLAECRSCLNPQGEVFILDALWPPGRNRVGEFLRRSDNGAFVRTLEQWGALLSAELEIRALRPVAQWPFDYVFVRAMSRCADDASMAKPAASSL